MCKKQGEAVVQMMRIFGLLVAATALLASPARAEFPDKTIRIVVPYTPGGFNDTLGRIVAQKFTDDWGVSAVVENRPGGGTLIGTDSVAKAPADGYTLLVVAFPFAVNPSLYAKLPYDTLKDFAPLILAGQTPNLLVVNNDVPVRSVKELIAAAKAEPGKLSYGSTGSGSSNHLSMELFRLMTATSMIHVPYKGSAPMVTDLLGGHVQVAFDNVPNVITQVKAGKLRALAITSPGRAASLPDIPTVAEAGVPGYEVGVWFGIVAPAATPPDVLARLNAELNKILAMPDVKQKFADQGVEPVGGTGERFGEHLRTQIEKWGRVVKESGAKVE
jgi:tripartite-type tricarboxylate transporter receptor subunit TctC